MSDGDKWRFGLGAVLVVSLPIILLYIGPWGQAKPDTSFGFEGALATYKDVLIMFASWCWLARGDSKYESDKPNKVEPEPEKIVKP